MAGWLTIMKSIGAYITGWGASLFMAWIGLSELWRWCTTGALLGLFRGTDHVRRWQLVTYESDPFNFVSLLTVYGMVAVTGVTICAMQCLMIRRWWLKRPAQRQ